VNQRIAPAELADAAPASRTSRARVAIVLVGIVGGAFAFGVLRMRSAKAVLSTQAAQVRVPRVEVISPKPVDGERALEMPGVVKALEEAQIYPRATGYVSNWFVDLGDKVAAGQLLAEIEAPELEAQLAQAKAQVAQAQATLKLAMAQHKFSKTNAERFGNLASQDMVSKAQAEQTATQAATDDASVAAARAALVSQAANVRRLREMRQFTKITAPFAGTIARRGIDRGTLVTDGKTTEMFDIVATDPVRIFVDVPQSVAPGLHVGMEAKLTVGEYGTRIFTGKVTRASSAMDPVAHTMTTEILVPNPDGALHPGMYVRASLALLAVHQLFEIPATALYSDASGLRVAKVDSHKQVHFVAITVERDTGAALQLASGVTGEDKLLKIALPTLVDGDTVEVVGP
jgi:RND family efflux transporter MFP subunit